jgi:hypothetical protein
MLQTLTLEAKQTAVTTERVPPVKNHIGFTSLQNRVIQKHFWILL